MLLLLLLKGIFQAIPGSVGVDVGVDGGVVAAEGGDGAVCDGIVVAVVVDGVDVGDDGIVVITVVTAAP